MRALSQIDPNRAAEIFGDGSGAAEGGAENDWPQVLNDFSEASRRDLEEKLAERYPTGIRDGLTWVSDADELGDTYSRETLRRLGVPWSEEVSWVLALEYRREAIRSCGRDLHVPRALDGIDGPNIVVTTDCGAKSGATKPNPGLNASLAGFGETVHISCILRMESVRFVEVR